MYIYLLFCTGDLFVGTGAGISIPVSKLSGKKTFSSTRVQASGLIGPMRGCAGSWQPIRGQQLPPCHERCHWVTLVSARPGDIKDGWSRHQQTNNIYGSEAREKWSVNSFPQTPAYINMLYPLCKTHPTNTSYYRPRPILNPIRHSIWWRHTGLSV